MRRFALLSALILGLVGCGPRRTGSAVTVPPAEVLEDLSGNYTMKMALDGDVHYSTAVLKKLSENEFQIARITVYGPLMYRFTLREDASVLSEELGSGAVTYQPAIKKLTIRFEKGASVCELSR